MNPANFTNNSAAATGDKVALPKKDSPLTKLRRKGFQTIKKIASAKGEGALEVAVAVLGSAGAELGKYVQQKGLVPSSDINQLIAQAALLRLKDIGQTALIYNLSDDPALKELEEAESVAYEIGTQDIDNVMNPQVQAALLIVVDEILQKSKKANGIGTSKALVKMLSTNDKGAGDYNSNYNVNNLLVRGAANSFDFDTSQLFKDQQAADAAAAANTGGGTSSVTDWINTIVGSIGKIADIFKSTGGVIGDTISQVKDGVKNDASDIGADAIGKFFDKYKWWFIGGLVIILLIVIIAVYARRK